MLISIKLQFDSHKDIYGSISILSSQFMVLHFGLTLLTLTSISIFILLA
jgi:hypothetical protein